MYFSKRLFYGKFRRSDVWNVERGMKLVPLPMRYAYPPELDLMARLLGLQLKHRWGGWGKAAFTADSKFHVSVYEKPLD
ncbi:hypothetical protein [Yoonia maritima]|uniref:hypothetical protein n=1 Tax=Yoonia maritima TaxID=1435347 RepID=UPI000D101DEA|nr:hypothetical protein [Yoonia maritima]